MLAVPCSIIVERPSFSKQFSLRTYCLLLEVSFKGPVGRDFAIGRPILGTGRDKYRADLTVEARRTLRFRGPRVFDAGWLESLGPHLCNRIFGRNHRLSHEAEICQGCLIAVAELWMLGCCRSV